MSDDPNGLDAMRDAARAAGHHAHSPYSGFKVGAAVRAPGSVHVGCNVESGSYGLTQCAERNALVAAVVAGVPARSMDLLVVHVDGAQPLPPCGACRQMMLELMAPGAQVISCCDGEASRHWRIEELLPDAFRMEDHS